MKVYAMQGEYLSEITYIVTDGVKAVVIDPGTSANAILSACKKLGVELVAVLLTHGHIDHTLGAFELQSKGFKVYAHKEEVPVLEGRAGLSLLLGLPQRDLHPDVLLEDGAVISLLDFPIDVIFTPGHTQGGVCYLAEGALFSGDTLFPGAYGRTDFPTGDEQDLICSICNVLFDLPKSTEVYSGHGDCSTDVAPFAAQTTIGQEYSTNPILHLL